MSFSSPSQKQLKIVVEKVKYLRKLQKNFATGFDDEIWKSLNLIFPFKTYLKKFLQKFEKWSFSSSSQNSWKMLWWKISVLGTSKKTSTVFDKELSRKKQMKNWFFFGSSISKIFEKSANNNLREHVKSKAQVQLILINNSNF